MINNVNKNECCGCGACVNICPKKCIALEMDEMGFRYPYVNRDICVSCGMCDKVCPMKSSSKNGNERDLYAAYIKQDEILSTSSSGGVFWAIVEYVINDCKGIVYGVALAEGLYVRHERAETLNECRAFRGSKYLQSDVGLCYQMAKKDLEEKRVVLFSGTPCQIAGLYSFLQKDYDHLITLGVICHGVPSRRVFDKYISEKEAAKRKKIIGIQWRDKRFGWKPNHISLRYDDGTEETSTSQENPYQKGFLDNVYLRPSCYTCSFARLPRVEDISLADFWGYDGELDNQNKGISLVVISNCKAKKVMENIQKHLVYTSVDEEYAKVRSRHLWQHPKDNLDKEAVCKKVEKLSFKQINKRYINRSLGRRVLFKIKKIGRSFGIMN